MKTRPTAGERLRFLRLSQGWSLTELSGKTGISRSSLGRNELGQQILKVEEIERILRAFGKSMADFYGTKRGKAL